MHTHIERFSNLHWCTFIVNISFTDDASGIRLPDCSNSTINRQNDNDVTIFRHFPTFFWYWGLSLVKLRYWSKFHVSIITGSIVITIFVYKGLTRNPEIRNTPSQVCPISEDRIELGTPNLAWMSLMKSYSILKKGRVTAFTVSELLRDNKTNSG